MRRTLMALLAFLFPFVATAAEESKPHDTTTETSTERPVAETEDIDIPILVDAPELEKMLKEFQESQEMERGVKLTTPDP